MWVPHKGALVCLAQFHLIICKAPSHVGLLLSVLLLLLSNFAAPTHNMFGNQCYSQYVLCAFCVAMDHSQIIAFIDAVSCNIL